MPPQRQQSSTMGAGSRPPSPQTPTSAGRPQFRRQGSSYGPGHVHHMAVMVAPQRVDYSVNKGGLRSWIVLIVFVLLCSALLNIFSEEPERGEHEVALGEESLNNIDDDDNSQEVPPKIDVPKKHVHPTDEEDDDEENEEAGEEEEVVEPEKEEAEEEEEDEEDFEDQQRKQRMDEEERMLALLREKAAKRWKERQERAAQRRITREPIKSRQREEVEEEEEEEIEKEEENNEEEESSLEAAKIRAREETKILPRAEEPPENEDEDEEEAAEFFPKREKPGGGHKRVRSWRQLQTQRDEGNRPRKELLKMHKRKLPIHVETVVYEDDENDEKFEEDEQQPTDTMIPTSEVIALRKRPGYNRKAITNRGDYRFRQVLDSADYLLEQHEFGAAQQKYQQVLAKDAQSLRALFGRARLHQLRAEFAEEGEDENQQEELLERAMDDFERVIDNGETPDELFRISAEHFVECARFRGGQQHKILQVQRALVDRFPDDLAIQCQFGATFLGMNRPDEAATVFRNVLEAEPNHALAMAYYGYILKVHGGELERAVQLLRRAVRSGREEVTGDPKFYFHLGDGLTRLGRIQEAYAFYGDAVAHGLFPSILQRSMHNLKGLTAKPWWSMEQTECGKQLRQLERHWTAIKEDATQMWNKRQHLFTQERAHLVDPEAGGQWSLVLRGNSFGAELREEICEKMPSTCELLRGFVGSICAREKIKLSVLQSGTNSWPHCGPNNYVLEAHLGLTTASDARLRVGHEIRGWRQGKVFVFDTSFEREVIFEGAPANALRIALVLELWHPEVPQSLRGKIEEENDDGDEENH